MMSSSNLGGKFVAEMKKSSENTKTGIQFSKQLKPKKLEIWEKTRILPKF